VAVLEEDRARLGRVFARHAYGMRRWGDLFSVRVPTTDDPGAKQLLAELVADNAGLGVSVE
jgi:citrate synthase